MADLEYKQVIVVRIDVKMSVGKVAAQAAHVAVLASECARISCKDTWRSWFNEGYRKIVCQASSEQELLDVVSAASKKDLPFAMTRDLGLTEIEAGTLTAVAIGPGKNVDVDSVTGRLKLFK